MMHDTLNKPKFIDSATLLHFFLGIISYFILHIFFKLTFYKSLILYIILHTIYELKDVYYTYFKFYSLRPIKSSNFLQFGYHSDNSFYNSIGDTVYTILGFYIGMFFSKINILFR